MTVETSHIDLISVVEAEGIELKKSGSRYAGLCPFHSEKTPSFYVFPDNRFKCFGCGEHGNAIDFIRKLHGVGFKEALSILGIDTGKPISIETRRKKQKKNHHRFLEDVFKEWQRPSAPHPTNSFHQTIKNLVRLRQLHD